jgi:hypothetical protein
MGRNKELQQRNEIKQDGRMKGSYGHKLGKEG